jgi:hypothetical protein
MEALITYLELEASLAELQILYASSLRGPLFSGLLSIAGFLFSLQTFIVVKLKENVYDSDHYATIFRREVALGMKATRFSPLRKFATSIFQSIVGALIAAILQITLGLLSSPWASIACLLAAAIACTLLARSIWLIRKSLKIWFDSLDIADAAKAEIANESTSGPGAPTPPSD